MLLAATTEKLQFVLAAASTSVKGQAWYADHTTTTFVPGNNRIASNGTTDVDLVAAPAASTQRQVEHVAIYNGDSVNHTVTVKVDVSGTDWEQVKANIVPGQTLEWTRETGWGIKPLTTLVATSDASQILSGTYANLPAAGIAGRLYYPTDKASRLRDNGSSWEEWDTTTGGKLVLPNSGSFSWLNQGSASVTTTNGADVLTTPTGTNTLRGRSVTASNPMFVKARIAPKGIVGGNSTVGLFVSDGTKLVAWEAITTFGGNHMRTAKWATTTSFSATYTNYSTLPYGITPKWIGLQDDGTNLLFWMSDNGVDWTRVESRARLDYLASISTVGWFMNNETGSNSSSVLYSWEKS